MSRLVWNIVRLKSLVNAAILNIDNLCLPAGIWSFSVTSSYTFVTVDIRDTVTIGSEAQTDEQSEDENWTNVQSTDMAIIKPSVSSKGYFIQRTEFASWSIISLHI